jgi:predicted RNase H-like HicB family nuclease
MTADAPQILSNSSIKLSLVPDWRPEKSYRCFVAVFQEDDGESFSAYVLNLPGVASSGDSAEEALANVKEAVLCAVESYETAGQDIPWESNPSLDDIPATATKRWILVDA